MSDTQSIPGQPDPQEQIISQLKEEIQTLRNALHQERFKNRTLEKRVLFLGTHCDALSKLLEVERSA